MPSGRGTSHTIAENVVSMVGPGDESEILRFAQDDKNRPGDETLERNSQPADRERNFGAKIEVAHASGLRSRLASETLALQ